MCNVLNPGRAGCPLRCGHCIPPMTLEGTRYFSDRLLTCGYIPGSGQDQWLLRLGLFSFISFKALALAHLLF